MEMVCLPSMAYLFPLVPNTEDFIQIGLNCELVGTFVFAGAFAANKQDTFVKTKSWHRPGDGRDIATSDRGRRRDIQGLTSARAGTP